MPVVWPTLLDLSRDECKRILRKLGTVRCDLWLCMFALLKLCLPAASLKCFNLSAGNLQVITCFLPVPLVGQPWLTVMFGRGSLPQQAEWKRIGSVESAMDVPVPLCLAVVLCTATDMQQEGLHLYWAPFWAKPPMTKSQNPDLTVTVALS